MPASRLPSPYTAEPTRSLSMDVAEAPPHFLIFPRASSWLLASNRYIYCHTLHGNLYRFTLRLTNPCSLSRSVVISAKKGRSVDAFKGLCKVIWTIEADLEAGELLYVTGDPTVLGNWEPDMAILMSPTETENEWKAEIKIVSGVNFRYNYFIKAGSGSSLDIIWRTGPKFSLSVPSSVDQDRKIIVTDSWKRFSSKTHDAHVWGSWIEETYLPVQSLFLSPAADESKFVNNGLKESRPFLDIRKDKSFSTYKHATNALNENSHHTALFSERYQLVEEPWLLQPSITLDVTRDMQTDVYERVENVEDNTEDLEIDDQSHQITETLLPEQGIFSKAESVSTVILINSSICTMQRIAVLEDEKLVELLLEPVKTNVQCDNVYLGAVTKFVPHMGGAFVNIGSSKHSFMDIKPNREPFILPPFRERMKKREANGSLLQALGKSPDSHESEHPHFDIEVGRVSEIGSRYDSGDFAHDDDEEHVDDDLDVSEILVGNLNESIANYGQAEGDFEEYTEGELHRLEGQTVNGSLPLDIEGSEDLQTSTISDAKDSKDMATYENRWFQVRKGTKIIVQVVKEGLGTKGPTLTAYPKLRSRFWILITRCDRIGVSKKISGVERTRLKVIAKTLQPKGFGLTVRTVAAGRSLEELQKDLEGLLLTWKNIMEDAKSAALAADESVEGAIPVLLHRAMGQTLSVVQDYFNDKVKKMLVDSPRTYHEVTSYLQDIAPDLCDRVELYDKRIPLFDLYNIEEEIDSILSKRVPLHNGGSLVIEQTEALVSIDVNGGHGMFGQGNSQEKAILEVNLTAARQIARELRLRDIGGIIVVDFIDMADESNKRLVYEEVKKAVERDRSLVKVSELSRYGLMEITRKRVRPSVTFMISEPCSCCHATGRVEALETSFSKIEQEICRLLAKMDREADAENPKAWPKFILKVDNHMSNYLTTGKRTRLAILSSSLKVWILLKVARHFTRGTFEVKLFTDEKSGQRQHQVAISLLRKADRRSDGSGKKVTLIPIKKGKASGKRG